MWEADKISDKRWEQMLEQMYENVKFPTGKKMKTPIKSDNRRDQTSYSDYIAYVNDAVSELRGGRGYYIYSVSHIRELVKIFGRNLIVVKEEDYWYVYLKEPKKNYN